MDDEVDQSNYLHSTINIIYTWVKKKFQKKKKLIDGRNLPLYPRHTWFWKFSKLKFVFTWQHLNSYISRLSALQLADGLVFIFSVSRMLLFCLHFFITFVFNFFKKLCIFYFKNIYCHVMSLFCQKSICILASVKSFVFFISSCFHQCF